MVCNARAERALQCSHGPALQWLQRLLLWLTQGRWATPRFLTFKQAQELGGNVRKGEHGTRVYFVKRLSVRDPSDNDAVRIVPMMREYTVFNVDQCEGPAGPRT